MEQVQELVIDYTNCNGSATNTFDTIPNDKYSSSFKTKSTQPPQWKYNLSDDTPLFGVTQRNIGVCTLQFDIPNDIGPPVLLYYKLTNFYQNHRRYVKSLDTSQLNGAFISNSTIGGSACNPIKLAPNGKAYYPCGLIANSLFNDTIRSPLALNPPNSSNVNGETYQMTNKGIAWSSDANLYTKTKYTNDQVMPPPNWIKRFPDGYTTENPIPDLADYEEFQVWMRTAGLPTFSKLALRNDDQIMRAGQYQLSIADCEWFYLRSEQFADYCRLPCQGLRRHEVDFHLHENCHGRQELFPGHRLRRCRRSLRSPGRSLHSRPFDQAKVCY